MGRWDKPVITDNRPYLCWVCKECGHEVSAKDRPEPVRWDDGHVCYLVECVHERTKDEKMDS